VLLSIARAMGAALDLPPDGIAPRRPARAASQWQRRFREQAERRLPCYFAVDRDAVAPALVRGAAD